MHVSQRCYQSGPLKVIDQFSLQDSCKVCYHSLVGFDPSIVSQIGWLEFRFSVSFTTSVIKPFVGHQYLLTSVEKRLLWVSNTHSRKNWGISVGYISVVAGIL